MEVDEDALLHQYHLAKSLCEPNTAFICVVKANAYGLGLFRTVKTLLAAGADWFAVAAPEEALTVRRAAPAPAGAGAARRTVSASSGAATANQSAPAANKVFTVRKRPRPYALALTTQINAVFGSQRDFARWY